MPDHNEQDTPPLTDSNSVYKTTTHARLTVTGTVYHQRPDENPQSLITRFSRWLPPDVEPYRRSLVAKPTWQMIDYGWVEHPAAIIVKSELTSRTKDSKPIGPEDVIEIGVFDPISKTAIPIAILRPGMSLPPIEPPPLAKYMIRSRGGNPKYTLLVIPG